MRYYILGDALSNFGDYALFLAMAIWVKTLTGSTSAAGLVMFAFAGGSLLLPLSGLLVDRFRRRPLLAGSYLLSAAVVLLLLLVKDRDDVWLVYVIMFLYGALGSVTGPAQNAFLPTVVPDEERLGDANGAVQAMRGLLRVFAPIIGAGLFAWQGAQVVVLIDAAVFAVAAVAVLLIRVHEPAPTRTAQPLIAETTGGLRFLRDAPNLRRLVLACALTMLVIGFFESIAIAVVTDGLGRDATFLAVLAGTQAVGTIAGGTLAGAVIRRVTERGLVVIALVMVGASSLLLTVTTVPAVIAGMLVLGVAAPWIVIGATTSLQRRTPEDLRGRVFAAFEFGVTVPQVASIAAGASLIATLDYRVMLVAVCAVVLVSALILGTERQQPEPPARDDRTARGAPGRR
ncbi:MFS family permease [Nonomuraea soli]|uniref:MFS family permease n=2 Tax=Nonomuraea soli TaxID=1032476 RepID=A0A7W0CHU2_9ACTN|nr:MFS transporter [Nonomuraea soli]MBA2891477.1 MFS family permease [Nonomuraea soli]